MTPKPFAIIQPRAIPEIAGSSYIAHRGGRAYGEDNRLSTMQSMHEAALSAEAVIHGIEVDCLATKDHVVVLEHDSNLQGDKISELTLAEVQQRNPSILSLKELLAEEGLIRGRKIFLDVKPFKSYEESFRTIDCIHELLKDHPHRDQFEVQSGLPGVVCYGQDLGYNGRLILGVASFITLSQQAFGTCLNMASEGQRASRSISKAKG